MADRTGFVGREAELAALTDLIRRAAGGRGSVVFIEGEPGIGKSRLLDEALGVATGLGFAVLRGAGRELERDRPFGAVVEALEVRVDAPDPRRAEVAGLLRTPQAPADAWEGGPLQRYRVVDAVLALIEDLCAGGPAAVAFDDLHWADGSTLLVVRRLAERANELPLIVLTASRPIPRSGELAATMEAMRADGLVHLELGPLPDVDAVRLATSVMGRPPDAGWVAGLSRAAGNPLLLAELAAAHREDERGADRADEAPTFAGSVLRRLRFLSPDALHVLRHASILGSMFSVGDLAVLLGRPVTELVEPLDEALGSRLLVEEGDRLRFRHDLVRESVYTDLPRGVRLELHAHAARVLAAAGRPPAQVAAHLLRGAAPGDDEAVRWLHRAAKESLDLEPTVTADLLERARELGGAAARDPDLLADLLMAYVWLGRLQDAESLAREILGADGDASRGDQVRVLLARALMFQGRADEGMAVLEPALAATDGRRAAMFAMGTTLRVVVGDVEGARRLGEEGVRLARHAGDPGDEAVALAALGMAERSNGNPLRAVDLATDALAAADAAGTSTPPVVTVFNLAGLLYSDVDRLDEASAILADGRSRMEERGIVWGQAECLSLTADVLFHMGRWDDAVAEAETAIGLCRLLEAWHAFAMATAASALVATRRGDLARAADLVTAARERLASAPHQAGRPFLGWAAGLLREAQGDDRGAAADLAAAWNDSAGIVSDEATFGPDLVRIAIRTGDRTAAAAVAARLEAAAGTSGLPRADAAATLCRGLVDGDVDALVRSADAYRVLPRPAELARACEAAGGELGRRGSVEDGLALLRRSVETGELLGAVRDVARVDAALRALGAPRGRAGARRRPATGLESLTPTERSVVDLVAEGLRNREIAERLFISRRTVETHLTHVFAKVGVSSRTELVAARRRDGS